jgi:hypothetical protein
MFPNEDHFHPTLPREPRVSAPNDAIFVENGSRNTLGHIPYSLQPLSRTAAEKLSAKLAERAFIARLKGSRSDRRRIVGARVHAKALLVTSEEECRHQYESMQGTKLVSGTVVDVEISKTAQSASVFITTDFNLEPSFVKRKRQNVRSVYAGEASSYPQCC